MGKNFKKFTYVPFIGWFFPMTFQKDDPESTHQALQGFLLSVVFTSLLAAVYVLGLMVPGSWRIFRLTLIIMIYVMYLLYFGICGYLSYTLYKNKVSELPLLSRYAKKIDI